MHDVTKHQFTFRRTFAETTPSMKGCGSRNNWFSELVFPPWKVVRREGLFAVSSSYRFVSSMIYISASWWSELFRRILHESISAINVGNNIYCNALLSVLNGLVVILSVMSRQDRTSLVGSNNLPNPMWSSELLIVPGASQKTERSVFTSHSGFGPLPRHQIQKLVF